MSAAVGFAAIRLNASRICVNFVFFIVMACNKTGQKFLRFDWFLPAQSLPLGVWREFFGRCCEYTEPAQDLSNLNLLLYGFIALDHELLNFC